jgi:hypothetical protein
MKDRKWRLTGFTGPVTKAELPKYIATREQLRQQLQNCTAEERSKIEAQLRVIDAVIANCEG